MVTKKDSARFITVAGASVPVTFEMASIDKLRLDPDNPRIRFQFVHGAAKKPSTQEDLRKVVMAQPGYEHLQKQIRKQKGVHDPLIVRHDGRIVEGNSRFAAVSVLAAGENGQPFRTVPILRLGLETEERTIQLLMADYHIAGKTQWRPAAQADQMRLMLQPDSGITIEEVAEATRMTPNEIRRHIAAYEFLLQEVLPLVETTSLVERQAILEKRFSHALEFVSRKNLEPYRSAKSERRVVAKLIANNTITGQQVRKLPVVMTNPKAKEALQKSGFKAASETLKRVDPTADSSLLRSMQALASKLEKLDQDDIRLFKSEAKARQVLSELLTAAENVMSLTTSRKASARA